MALHKKNLLWDLGNTLIKIDEFAFARQMGLTDLIIYCLSTGNHPRKILLRALDFLDAIPYTRANACQTTLAGRPLPPVVCDWFAGKITDVQALHTNKSFPIIVPEGFFTNKREEHLVKNLLKTIANPEVFAHCISIIDEGLLLLEKCANQLDEEGNNAHTLYIFSNWDKDSFNYLVKDSQMHRLFSYFKTSHQIISGNIGYLKPGDEAFFHLLTTHNLVASECILIDDQDENIRAALKNGMQGILLENTNFQKVRIKLQEYGVLPSKIY